LDTAARLETMQLAEDMWEEHPWWGVGPGLFDYHYRPYRPERFQIRPEHAHNDYLELLADYGLAGGLIFLGGVGLFIFGLVKTWPHVRRAENDFGTGMSSRYAFFLGAVSGVFALAVHSLVDFNLHVPANVLAFVTVLGLVVANVRFATKRHWVRLRLPFQWCSTLLLGGLLVFLGNQLWRRGGELLWTARAEAQPSSTAEQATAYQQALACEPKNSLTAYNIGECYRTQSLDGDSDYAEKAQRALDFYAQASRLNPDDGNCPLRLGMCLDWLGRHDEAEPYFSTAEALDPNGNFVVANIGLHYVAIGDYAAARQWFLRGFKLANYQNDTAQNYLYYTCEPKLIERASGKLPSLFYRPIKKAKDH
jgi:hypothetical protein